MADSNTPRHDFILPEVGSSQDSWGDKLNTNWSDVDTLLPLITPPVIIEVVPSGSSVEFLNLPPGVRHARLTAIFTRSDVSEADLFCQLGTFADGYLTDGYTFNMKEHFGTQVEFGSSLSFRGTNNTNSVLVRQHAFWDLILGDSTINNRWHCHAGGAIQESITSLTSGSGSIELGNVLDRIKVQATAGDLSVGKCTLEYS